MHKGWVLSLVSVLILLLTACSPESVFKALGVQENDEPPRKDEKVCGDEDKPQVLHSNYHEMGILTSEKIPEHLAVVLEGELKYNECLESPSLDPAPIVTVEKELGVVNIKVTHYDAYSELPKSVSFQVLNMRNCRQNPVTFYSAQELPLEFKEESPQDPCGATYVHAEVTVIK